MRSARRRGAWHLSDDANESRRGFLLNHLISEELPTARGRVSNSDPVTGQAGWYDVRVRIYPRRPTTPRRLAAVRADARRPRASGARRAPAGLRGRPHRERGEAHDSTRVGHRPQRLRRLPCLRDLVQGMEHLRRGRPDERTSTPTTRSRTAPSSTACRPSRSASSRTRRRCTSRSPVLHCEDPPRACRSVRPALRTSARRTASSLVDYDKCIGCKYCSWACPYGARELDEQQKVMKRHPVRRPHLRREPAGARPPAFLRARLPDQRAPVRRHPRRESVVSKAIRERSGYALMPEWGTQPANHYLPRRRTEAQARKTSWCAPTTR